MCARYSVLNTLPPDLAAFFDAKLIDAFEPAEDIRPTNQAPIVISQDNRRQLVTARWGLVPPWQDDPKEGKTLFNARGETLEERPSFRAAFRSRRCLIPATGFYEWPEGVKTFFAVRQTPVFAFAGLWEIWQPQAENLRSYTMVTTAPNSFMSGYHNRMPVILRPEVYDLWLDPQVSEPEVLKRLFDLWPEDAMVIQPPSRDDLQTTLF